VTATYEPDPDDAADDELAAEIAGHPATVEEAMEAVTPEDGHSGESAYVRKPDAFENDAEDDVR
jgi:hypothetical protein